LEARGRERRGGSRCPLYPILWFIFGEYPNRLERSWLTNLQYSSRRMHPRYEFSLLTNVSSIRSLFPSVSPAQLYGPPHVLSVSPALPLTPTCLYHPLITSSPLTTFHTRLFRSPSASLSTIRGVKKKANSYPSTRNFQVKSRVDLFNYSLSSNHGYRVMLRGYIFIDTTLHARVEDEDGISSTLASTRCNDNNA
jgi:hypothetical protein